MHISCAEVIELFGDSDSENWDDFAGFSPDDIDDLDGHNGCRNDNVTVSVAYSADNDDFASDSDLDNNSEMEPTEDATLWPTTVGGCVFWWLVCTEFNSNRTHNYQIHNNKHLMMMIVTDTLSNLVADVSQNCRLTGYMCNRYWLVRNFNDSYIYWLNN